MGKSEPGGALGAAESDAGPAAQSSRGGRTGEPLLGRWPCEPRPRTSHGADHGLGALEGGRVDARLHRRLERQLDRVVVCARNGGLQLFVHLRLRPLRDQELVLAERRVRKLALIQDLHQLRKILRPIRSLVKPPGRVEQLENRGRHLHIRRVSEGGRRFKERHGGRSDRRVKLLLVKGPCGCQLGLQHILDRRDPAADVDGLREFLDGAGGGSNVDGPQGGLRGLQAQRGFVRQ
mmetsp:Transcript_113611/g.301890  ORF Transcript_113611/g.301890 Transcript_113611/m.301890 type:complete len:235 (+) Transcript_113611:3-707(+)